MSSDTAAMTGAYLDDVTGNCMLAGIRSSWIRISPRNTQSEVVQLDDITDN